MNSVMSSENFSKPLMKSYGLSFSLIGTKLGSGGKNLCDVAEMLLLFGVFLPRLSLFEAKFGFEKSCRLLILDEKAG